jgi:hypothetical protein
VKPCCSEKKTEDEGCCSDETIDFESSDEPVVLNNSGADFLVTNIPTEAFSFQCYNDEVVLVKNVYDYSYRGNAPPLYKLYCQYIVYS